MLSDGQLDKIKVKKSFAQAASTYDAVADLQRKVGQQLLAQIIECQLAGTIMDIGCGTGFLTAELAALNACQQVVGLDIALPMLQTTRRKLNSEKVLLLCADAERLAVADQSVNHIVSNLALQWCDDLTAVFTDFKRVLKADGQLVFSTFAQKTLQELKTAWAKVDDYSHVNYFYHADEITAFLQQAGFAEITIESKTYISCYDSVFALMRELKAIGAHNVTKNRRKSITGKQKMLAMIAEYEKLRCEGLIPATFEIITVTARI
jgi:malonyl-CoA O-methyltransferase